MKFSLKAEQEKSWKPYRTDEEIARVAHRLRKYAKTPSPKEPKP